MSSPSIKLVAAAAVLWSLSAGAAPRSDFERMRRCVGAAISAQVAAATAQTGVKPAPFNPAYESGLSRVLQKLLDTRYRVTVEGLTEILARGNQKIFFLPNHPSYLDPLLVLSAIGPVFNPAPLIHELVTHAPLLGSAVKSHAEKLGGLYVPDVLPRGKDGAQAAARLIQDASARLQSGRNILGYPAGRVTPFDSTGRLAELPAYETPQGKFNAPGDHTIANSAGNRITEGGVENIEGRTMVPRILREVPDARIVLIKTEGLIGSVFSHANGGFQPLRAVGKSLGTLLTNGFGFAPKRDVKITLFEPQDFPRNGTAQEISAYLQNFYNATPSPNIQVPYHFLDFRGRRVTPSIGSEPPLRTDPVTRIKPADRQKIVDQLVADFGLQADTIRDGDALTHLGIDSIDLVNLTLWMEEQFPRPTPLRADRLQTVGDLFRAASGEPEFFATPAPSHRD